MFIFKLCSLYSKQKNNKDGYGQLGVPDKTSLSFMVAKLAFKYSLYSYICL